MQPSLETLFVRYRQTGQPQALGEAFDRASPQLLAVALHLCAHPADAEDALQATFVAAIDAAHGWDASRPLLPWLLGILTKQCRRIGERRARRREEALPDEPLLLDDGTPLAASERRELVAKLREHIDRLPVQQRQVLLLQLEHGLAPAEVAEVLGVPPGTVRMRLHRGLQTLRGVLPASLVALLMAALPSRGVAAVRTAVVGHAAVAAAVLVGGSMLMKKVLVVAAALVLLGLGTAVLAPMWSAAPAAAKAPAVLVQVPADPSAEASDPGAPARTAAPLPASLPAPMEPPAPAPSTGSLLVRTLHENGGPLPREPFRFSPEAGEMEPIMRTGITDDAGEARIDGLAPGPWRVKLLRGLDAKHATVAAGKVAEVSWTQSERHAQLHTLHCLVVHADGQPAAVATVTLGGLRGGEVPLGVTDGGGRFAAELRSNLGVGARLAGHAASPVMYCYPRKTITLVLGGPEAVVEGTVIDGEGRPIAGAVVEIGPRGNWVPDRREDDMEMPPTPQVEVTDGAGRCTVRELIAASLQVRIRAPGFAEYESGVETVAGTATELRWQLVAGDSLRGLVTDEGGKPLQASVQLDGECFPQWRNCGEDGRFHFPYAPSGVAHIEANASAFLPRKVEVASVRAGEPIVLRRRPVFALRLVDERGQPLANWHVCQMPRWTQALRTDENGAVQVVPRVREPQQVFVSPPDAIEATVALPWPHGAVPGVPFDVVVPDSLAPTATVHGVVVAADGSTMPDRNIEGIELRSPAGRKLAEAKPAAGAFRFTNVPSGDWQLRVRRRDRGYTYDAGIPVLAVARGEVRDLGSVRAGADGTLRIDVRTGDGRVPHGVRVLLFDRDGDDTSSVPRDGNAHAIPCGVYRWQVFAEGAAWRTGEVEVRAGERTDLDIVLPPGTSRSLRITSPAWVGHEGSRVEYCLRGSDGTLAYRSDRATIWSTGGIEFTPTLATGTWHVDATLDDGRRFTGSFEVTSLAPPSAPTHVVLAPAR